MTPNHIGYGSFFHAVTANSLKNLEQKNTIENPRFFYTGRHAVKAIIDEIIKTRSIDTIWLPNYYCQHVTSWLKRSFSNIHFYDIDPFEEDSFFSIESFADGDDIVLLNNFWGIFSYNVPKTPDGPICIEDHSHGWLSPSCLNSNAHYCFASLRKTMPIPLGGVLWRPDGKSALDESTRFSVDSMFNRAWSDNQTAMMAKTSHLKNEKTEISKSDYLELIGKTESFLHKQFDVVEMQTDHIDEILKFFNKDYMCYKQDNLTIAHKFKNYSNLFKVLERPGYTTFGLNLAFKDEKTLNLAKSFLIDHMVYPSELWPNNLLDAKWRYLLNVHLDFRYNSEDIVYISNILELWCKKMSIDV